MRYQLAIVFAGILLITSCEKDIKVDVPQQGARLVLNSVNILGERFRIRLGNTVPVQNYNGNKQPDIPNATIILFENEVPADTLEYHPDEAEYVSEISSRLGYTYKIQAMAPGFPSVEATAETPVTVPMTLGYEPNIATNRFNEQMDGLNASFTDPLQTANDYYRLRIIKAGMTYQYYAGGCIESADRDIENLLDQTIGDILCYSGEGIFCNDRSFNGLPKTVSLLIKHSELQPVPDSNGNNSYIMVWLDHISEPYYKYLKTTAYLIHNNSSPFAEPTNASTNISNGYGIFTILARSQRNLR